MKMSDMVPLDEVVQRHQQERNELWLKTTADALELATEIWPNTRNGQAVYLTQDQWQRLRQVLLTLPDLGD